MAEIGNVTVRVDAVITDEQYREAMGAVRAANERMDLLEAENAKLRELVHALLQCSIEGDDICAKCSYQSPLHGRCMADVKASELGIEVPE